MSDSFATPWTVDFPVHGIMQARIQDWVAISFSKEFSQSRDQILVSCIEADSLLSEPPGNPLSFIIVQQITMNLAA